MDLNFSIISQFEIVFPGIVGGKDTDILSLALGLRYKLCGRKSGTQSLTFLIVCIFISNYYWNIRNLKEIEVNNKKKKRIIKIKNTIPYS